MNKIVPTFVLLLGLCLCVQAQNTEYVQVHKDSVIQMLQAYRAEEGLGPAALNAKEDNSTKKNKSEGTRVKERGFRVQIYSGSSRSEAYDVQSRFKAQFKEYGSYINYDEPNYRVKVGDFTSRSQANRFRNILKNYYNDVFVFTEDIWVYQ